MTATVATQFDLADLFREHRAEPHPLALDECFGDGALLSRIPALARAREALLSRGYRFAPSDELSPGSTLAPLLQLDAILESRIIPYARTETAVSAVLDRRAKFALESLALRDLFTASQAHHEGAHALFYEIVCEREGVPPRGSHRVAVLVASEAFAMAVEAFAALHDPLKSSTALFLSVCSYADPFGYEKHERASPGVLQRLHHVAVKAPAQFLHFMACAFLVSNLRPRGGAGRPELAYFLRDHTELTNDHDHDDELLLSDEDACCALAIGFDICPDFRQRTASTFFRFLGLEDELAELHRAPLQQSFEAGSPFYDHIRAAIAVLVGVRSTSTSASTSTCSRPSSTMGLDSECSTRSS